MGGGSCLFAAGSAPPVSGQGGLPPAHARADPWEAASRTCLRYSVGLCPVERRKLWEK